MRRADLLRPPSCLRCGLVDGVNADRHVCSEAGAIAMRHGVCFTMELARSLPRAFAALGELQGKEPTADAPMKEKL